MQTVAAVVACRRDDEYVVVTAELQGASKHGLRFASRRSLASADVDDVRALLNCLLDGAAEIQLGEVALLVVSKDGHEEPPTSGRDASSGLCGWPKITLVTCVP